MQQRTSHQIPYLSGQRQLVLHDCTYMHPYARINGNNLL